MPYKLRDPYRHKFPKARYKVTNWPKYEKGLRNRGNICFWFSKEALDKWYCSEKVIKNQGRQRKYSDLSIQTGLVIKAVFKLPYRALEGFLNSICKLMSISLDIPDHTSFSRRAKALRVPYLSQLNPNKAINVIVDTTGLKVLGEGEWQAFKHKIIKKKKWRKLHLSIDERTQQIVANELTEEHISDEAMVSSLLKYTVNRVKGFKADRVYDSDRVYKAIERYANYPRPKVVIFPRPNAKRLCLFKVYPDKREKCTRHWFLLGPYRWQNAMGYNKRSLVETAMMRYKKLIGHQLYSRHLSSQKVEAKIGCLVLNKMLAMGKPVSLKVA